MQLEVLRFNKGSDSTNGILFDITNGVREFLCYTLEDESREEKVYGETCIPEGEYCIGFRNTGGHNAKYSKRFADIHLGMLHVLDVPNFKYILIHCGNTDEDTAGCLLLGNSQVNNNLRTNGYIGNSTEAYFNVYPRIAAVLDKGQDVTIKYTDFSILGE